MTPGLARVLCRAGSTDAFAEAATSVQETLGVGVPVETVRVLCEAVGTLAEAQAQDELAALQNGPRPEANGGGETRLVEVDGVQVPQHDGWHEMKVARVVPLVLQLHLTAYGIYCRAAVLICAYSSPKETLEDHASVRSDVMISLKYNCST